MDSGEPGNRELSRRKEIKSITDPPLNAPTGFRTGTAAAVSCKRRLEVWNDLVGVKMGRARERDEVGEKRGRSLEAMLADAMSAPASQVVLERLIKVATAPFACRTVWARPGASRPWHLTSILREFPRQVLHDRSFPGQHGSSSGMESRDMGPLMT